jgi:peroxiredoxin
MTELGELESHFQEFKKRKNPVEIVAISTDNREDAQKSQTRFPHLKVVADTDQKMCQTLDVMHPGAGSGGKDTAAPTTILVDGQGTVRWLFRPDRFLERLSPGQILAAIDEHLPQRGASAP